MSEIKECETKVKAPEIEDKELRKITDAYRKMNPTNRCFIVSASSMLLASQNAAEDKKQGRGCADCL